MPDVCAHPSECPIPPSHVIYVDELDERGYLTPTERDGVYVCTIHAGAETHRLISEPVPLYVHIVPLEPKVDPS